MAQTSTTPKPALYISSPSVKYPYRYDVFINHRGPDVKNTFASHFYYRLLSQGLQPFLDREVLQAGAFLSPQIEAAIRTAYVQIAIFSPRYAESRWCLDELVFMCESGATIVPIFYNVKPSELRSKDKDALYAKALRNHEQTGRYDRQTLENWRKALSHVSSIIGFELESYNGDEGKLLENVVHCVLKECRKIALNVAKPALYVATYPTGLEEKVEEFEATMLLQKQKSAAQVMGIVGLGGVGKTTLAKELFNRKSCNFNKSYFLFDCRETSRVNSLNSLQSKLLMGLTQRNDQIDSIGEGIEILRRYLSSMHALVVFDDVDHVHQLDALLPIKTVLHSDSLILVTSRYKDVLTSSGISNSSIYKLTGLNPQRSHQLFCSHAFLQPYPPPEFKDLVDEFCKACNGLPLSLKVFGALLYGQNDKYWVGQLDKLGQIKLPHEIKERLKISYDALDEEEKQIFLDIACYFIGEDRDMAIRIWDGSGWNGWVGLLNLESKCLIEVDIENNKLKMHDHLRDLGRNISDQENSTPRRLWQWNKDIDGLWQQLCGITEMRGITTVASLVDYRRIAKSTEEWPWFKSWCHVVFKNSVRKLIDSTVPNCFRKLQLVASEDGHLESILRRVESPNLIWIRWNNCPYSCLPAFIPMKNLRVLEVVGNKLNTLWGAESQAPLELRELTIYAPLLMLPKSIGQLKHIEKIVVDYVPELIHLKALPEELCRLRSLKYLCLRCPDMESLPNSFGYLTNLQHLDLYHCQSLQALPSSFGNLIRLKHLNMEGCHNMTMSMETFGNISTLEYLDLSQCYKVQVLPPRVAHQRSLKVFSLLDTTVKELLGDIGNLSNLEILYLGSHLLGTLPNSLGLLGSLKELWLDNCPELKLLPNSLGQLSQLSKLWIRRCGIQSLPPELVKLNNLVNFIVSNSPLRELPLKKLVEGERKTLTNPTGRKELSRLDSSIDNWQQQCMYRLEDFQIYHTKILHITFGEGVCPNLKHLDISYCDNLAEVGALPPTLIKLEIFTCPQLRKIEGICNLTKLQKLDIRKCLKVEDFPSLEALVSLEEFWADKCSNLKRIQGLGQLTELRILSVSFCNALEELSNVEKLGLLETLNAANCPHLQWGEGIVDQLRKRLKSLHL